MTSKNKHPKHTPPADAPENAPPVEGESLAGETPVNEAPVEPADSISVEEFDNLKTKAAKADENWDKYLRAAAELDNYRKRVAREKEELARFTTERVLAALLPGLDNLERAIDAAQKHGADDSAVLEGITQVYTQFRRSLVEFGLQEVVAQAGDPFDANLHEAVSQIESDEHPEGHVIEQLQRGYKLADRLLRPARVVVSKGQPSGQSETSSLESEVTE
jgi:molecular chaperone GrpE